MAIIPSTFTIEPFDPAVIAWTRWMKRLEGAFAIFEVPAERKVPYLLHYVGPTAFNVLADHLAPEDPYRKTYKEISEKFEEFYEPKPLEVAENFKLMQRKQQDGESIQDFIAALQKLSLNCKLGDYAKIALRNIFIYGLRNIRTQNRLLEIADLNLDKAVQIATTMELSEKGTKQLRGEETVAAVGTIPKKSTYSKDKFKKSERNKFQKQNRNNDVHANKENTQYRGNIVTCFRCGKNHYASACKMD
ncbi:uncharacterized protein [Temnothorax nylanderi]|uniref:uncharacterized protein n=1 Tax=Temnothorax nylanderi TaxID=102681 RepID=UPI003A8B96D0